MKAWEISRTLYKITDFISWKRSGSLVLSPSFQRRPVWRTGAKSYLIDTIIRGLPIPIIFLRERQSDLIKLEPIREVVDGQQRIRTIISFVTKELLEDYEPERDEFVISKTHNKEFSNKQFQELPKDIKQRILDYQFSVHVLPSETDDREVLQIFARMNSTGVGLNNQELRNAEFFGEFKSSVYDAALRNLNRWRKWKVFSEDNIARMEEVELTSEFYSLMLNGITGKSQKALSNLYKAKDQPFTERPLIESRFDAVMDAIDDFFGNDLSLMFFNKKTLFYIFFAIIYDCQFGIAKPLDNRKATRLSSEQVSALKGLSERFSTQNVPEEVQEAATRRTTNPKERIILYTYIRKHT